MTTTIFSLSELQKLEEIESILTDQFDDVELCLLTCLHTCSVSVGS